MTGRGAGTTPEVLDRVAAVVAGAVPGLGAGQVRAMVAAATARRGALRQLDEHLAAHPDALASGSPDAPLPLIALAGLLAGEGCPGVTVPCCTRCGRQAELRHRTEGGRLCDACYRGARTEPCTGCGRDRVVHKRTAQGPLCGACSPQRAECAQCGRLRRVAARRRGGAPLCGTCAPRPVHACASCGTVAPANARTPAGPVCKACYVQPPRECGECGQTRPVARRAAGADPDLCSDCARRPLAACAACGQQRRCSRRWSQPVCGACRRAGHRPEPPRRGAAGKRDPEASRAQHAARARRVLPLRLAELLSGPGPGVPAQLEPLLAVLADAPNPGSVLDWITRRAGGRLLAGIAARARQEPVTHDLLDSYPQSSALHHLRQLLVHAGVLPGRTEYLDRMGPWLARFLAACPPAHAAAIRPFATWHVLRRARGRARRQGFTPSAARWARSRIQVAAQFLAWLGERGTSLAAATQADADAWLEGATQHRYLVRAFTEWAVARGLASGITIPAIQRAEPASFPGEDARWQLLRRCLDDAGLPADVRAAGALLLLYGQFTTRLARMTAGDISHDGGDVYLLIGTAPALLPPKVAAVVLAQLGAVPARANYRQSEGSSRPLFPGRQHGPAGPETIARRLRRHGIAPRQSRNAALAGWAAELPAPVLADILGLNVSTAEAWAQRTRRDWTGYIAERAGHPGTGSSFSHQT